jgi:hypothetical protein
MSFFDMSDWDDEPAQEQENDGEDTADGGSAAND